MKTYQRMKFPLFVGTLFIAALLTGCGGKADEGATASTPANPTGAGGAMATSNQMPPEVKARMEQQQADQKARAAAQGQAMMSNQQGAAPTK